MKRFIKKNLASITILAITLSLILGFTVYAATTIKRIPAYIEITANDEIPATKIYHGLTCTNEITELHQSTKVGHAIGSFVCVKNVSSQTITIGLSVAQIDKSWGIVTVSDLTDNQGFNVKLPINNQVTLLPNEVAGWDVHSEVTSNSPIGIYSYDLYVLKY